MRFTLLSKFDASGFSMTVVVYSQTGHFADFEKFKIDSHFADFGHVKIDFTYLFLLILGRSQLF